MPRAASQRFSADAEQKLRPIEADLGASPAVEVPPLPLLDVAFFFAVRYALLFCDAQISMLHWTDQKANIMEIKMNVFLSLYPSRSFFAHEIHDASKYTL